MSPPLSAKQPDRRTIQNNPFTPLVNIFCFQTIQSTGLLYAPYPNDEMNTMRHTIYHRLDGTLNTNTRNTAAITVPSERTATKLCQNDFNPLNSSAKTR